MKQSKWLAGIFERYIEISKVWKQMRDALQSFCFPNSVVFPRIFLEPIQNPGGAAAPPAPPATPPLTWTSYMSNLNNRSTTLLSHCRDGSKVSTDFECEHYVKRKTFYQRYLCRCASIIPLPYGLLLLQPFNAFQKHCIFKRQISLELAFEG